MSEELRSESGWLIEEDAGGITHWIALATDQWPRTELDIRRNRRGIIYDDGDLEIERRKYRTPVVRVKDANLALRFARKEDAEAFIKLFDRFLLCPVATEHMWPALDGRVEAMREACAGAVKYMRHDGLCAIIGGYGYCSCGFDEALSALPVLGVGR